VAIIYHVEHGDTKYDMQDRAQGLINEGLSHKGEMQARSAGRALADLGIDCVYCSPLKRTRQTAEIVAKALKAKVIVRPNLAPLDIGSLAGKKNSTVKPYLEFFYRRPTLAFPKGESIGPWAEKIKKEWLHQFKDDDPVIAVVSHARDMQLIHHWAKNGFDAELGDVKFDEPRGAQITKLVRNGNSISIRKVQ